MSQRNYRDPLHNIISLLEDVPRDRLIVELIDTREFQRLRRIKQLGLAMFTYQGAEHSRFTHSLGVMHLMTRALDLLANHFSISEEVRIVGRTGALLHDLGHGPFSHVMEKVFHFHHEEWTRRVILDQETEVNRVLRAFDPDLPDKLRSLYAYALSPSFVSQLVSSQLDCDRMDYLLRDSLMTGVKYGIYDLEWVLHALRIDVRTGTIFVESKGLYAVEEYLQARYYMFRQVYFHRTLRSAEAVLITTLKRAAALMESGCLALRQNAFEKMLANREVTTSEFLQLDDVDVTFHLKEWTRESDAILADLASRFVERKLFKALDVELPGDLIPGLLTEVKRVAAGAGFDPDYYVVVDRAVDTPYYGFYSPEGADPRGLIYVETSGAQPVIREISEVSDVVRRMRGYRIDRLCVPHEIAPQVSRLICEHAGANQCAG